MNKVILSTVIACGLLLLDAPRPQLTRTGTASIAHTDTRIPNPIAAVRIVATDIATIIVETTGGTITARGTNVPGKCHDG